MMMHSAIAPQQILFPLPARHQGKFYGAVINLEALFKKKVHAFFVNHYNGNDHWLTEFKQLPLSNKLSSIIRAAERRLNDNGIQITSSAVVLDSVAFSFWHLLFRVSPQLMSQLKQALFPRLQMTNDALSQYLEKINDHRNGLMHPQIIARYSLAAKLAGHNLTLQILEQLTSGSSQEFTILFDTRRLQQQSMHNTPDLTSITFFQQNQTGLNALLAAIRATPEMATQYFKHMQKLESQYVACTTGTSVFLSQENIRYQMISALASQDIRLIKSALTISVCHGLLPYNTMLINNYNGNTNNKILVNNIGLLLGDETLRKNDDVMLSILVGLKLLYSDSMDLLLRETVVSSLQKYINFLNETYIVNEPSKHIANKTQLEQIYVFTLCLIILYAKDAKQVNQYLQHKFETYRQFIDFPHHALYISLQLFMSYIFPKLDQLSENYRYEAIIWLFDELDNHRWHNGQMEHDNSITNHITNNINFIKWLNKQFLPIAAIGPKFLARIIDITDVNGQLVAHMVNKCKNNRYRHCYSEVLIQTRYAADQPKLRQQLYQQLGYRALNPSAHRASLWLHLHTKASAYHKRVLVNELNHFDLDLKQLEERQIKALLAIGVNFNITRDQILTLFLSTSDHQLSQYYLDILLAKADYKIGIQLIDNLKTTLNTHHSQRTTKLRPFHYWQQLGKLIVLMENPMIMEEILDLLLPETKHDSYESYEITSALLLVFDESPYPSVRKKFKVVLNSVNKSWNA